ncbi:MAG: class I SAM-dependent methyltransferase [bacterium]
MWPFLRERIAEKNASASSWLDLCCGAGSLLTLACKDGYSCVGLDVSPHQLRHARRNAPAARFVTQDVRSLSLPQSFDVITCMFDSLNYIKSHRDLEMVFRKARTHLNARGLFIFDMNTYEGLQDDWCRMSVIHNPMYTLVVESSFDPGKALGRCLITGFMKDRHRYKRFQEEHLERGYRSKEIETRLLAAGFRFEKYDGNTLAPPGARPGRLLYICKAREKAPR